jgi:amino acid adenylation domain-containing protein
MHRLHGGGSAMINVSQWIDRAASAWPNHTALVTKNASYTYAALQNAIDAFAHTCARFGLQKGDRVAIYLPNAEEAVISILGTLKFGGIFVILHPHTTLQKLQYYLEDSGASMLIATEKIALDETSLQLKAKLFVQEPNGGNQATTDNGWHSFWECIAGGRLADNDTPLAHADDIAGLIYTSGSTGKPKGVISTHANIIFSTNAINKFLQHAPGDRVLSFLPLSFDYGLYQLFLIFSSGATLILRDSTYFMLEMQQLIINEKITGLPGLRNIFSAISAFTSTSFPTVRYVTNTGDSLPQPIINNLSLRFPSADLFLMYGVTECKRVSYLPPRYVASKINSVGFPLEGTTAIVVDESGNECPPMVPGELVVKGPHVCLGYWNNATETSKTYVQRGNERHLYTGDIFYKDDEGFLYLLGRKDHMFKSRGFRIDPVEIENAILHQFAEIKDAIVVGIPDETLGKKICCYVAVKEYDAGEKILQQLKRYCQSAMEPWKRPEYFCLGESLPLTSSGKIDRKKIEQIITASMAETSIISGGMYGSGNGDRNDQANDLRGAARKTKRD